MYVFGRAVELLLVGYHERERHQQRMEREPQQRQHQRQDPQLRVARAQQRMMALLTLSKVDVGWATSFCCPPNLMITDN